MSVTNDTFSQLRNAILAKRPILKELVTKRGEKSLYEYTKDYISVNLNPPIQQRQDELVSTFQEEIAKLLGDDIAAQAARQLSKYYYVSTADHHGPINSPFFVNANLVLAAPYKEIADPDLKYVIVLACASISFRNSSFPRGLFFHNGLNKKGMQELERISFFPASMRACPVFNWRAYTTAEVELIIKDVITKQKNKLLQPTVADKLVKTMQEVYLAPQVLAAKTFSDQMTITNYALWNRFFGHAEQTPAQLITLEQETLVMRLLLKYHLDQDTVLHHLLFDAAYELLLDRYFDNIMGGYSKQNKYGSYLFWALPPGGKYREQLWKQGNALVTNDGQYRVELTPDSIRAALERREIFPTTLLDFFVLSFYYGLKCVGGFNQINYLTEMKNAYIKLNVDRMNYRSIEVCARAQTKEMNDGFILAFISDAQQHTAPATGLDLLLYSDTHTWPKLLQTTRQLSVKQAIDLMYPQLYPVVYNEVDRDPSLSAITTDDIAALERLQDTIKPCVQLAAAASI